MSRKMTLPNLPAPVAARTARSYGKHSEMDFDKMYKAMEKGHRVCKMSLLKKWDPAYKMLTLKLETRLLVLNKTEQGAIRNKPIVLDIRTIREVQTLEFKQSEIKISDKWRRDKEIQNFDPAKILVISHGTGFTLQLWILLFESVDTCRLWSKGVHNLMLDTRDRDSSCHTIRIERFLSRHFEDLKSPINDIVARKHMKPFVQTSLQFKVQSKQLQETTEDQMDVRQFMKAARQIIHVPQLFKSLFGEYSDDGVTVSFANFLRFLQQKQNEENAGSRQKVVDLLRRFLHQDQAFNHERIEPTLSVMEFCDFLFSRENSLWDPMNEKVIQDMSKPLSHYWIASSHNTYLTGDQLRSESSLDSYAQALLMGCRCIELDCWDGQKKPGSQEFQDIVIYHGYTMTSKLLLRDVLYTIRHYAFINSEYPVILSIEDNCSVPAQRLLASEVKEILGDYLLTQPVNRDETALPSPASIKKKIILKHKKLTVETLGGEGKTPVTYDEFDDNDSILNSKDCMKKGVLYLKNSTTHDWKSHLFVLFQDRLCFLMETCSDDESQDTMSMAGDDEKEEEALAGFGVRPEEQHVTEEWFHGRCERQAAAARLLQFKEKGNGLFMIRDSNLFIGDFSLSILHDGKVHHVRIRTKMVEREKKYYFMDNKVCDTLYELVSYYTRHYLTTPNFRMALTIACPQPQPHLNEPWFHATADKDKAEELLNRKNQDGAFLIRMSSSDENVFVLSIRVDGEFWHYRLKRDGRLFVVNQTAFENLNQIVEYYHTREFVRGISLRFPIDENDLNNSEDVGQAEPGFYLDIKQLEKPVQARAIRPHHAQGEDELDFPIDAMITVVKKEGDLWRGRYGSKVGWFKSTCVQEIMPEKHGGQSEANYYTIELVGTSFERVAGDGEKQYAMRIKTASNGQQWTLAASSREDIEDWFNYLVDNSEKANDKFHIIRSKEKERKIAAELSNLVVYCQAVPFDPAHIENGSFYEMCSFVENKLDKLLEKGLVQFNMKQLSRVYPNGSRITSTNYNPVPMWNAACHMVALNYQTGDRAMQVNQGKFMANGQCGFILKPKYMIDSAFEPLQGNRTSSSSVRVCIKVIAGRHLSRKDKNKGICSPFVEIEIIGLQCDEKTFKTRTIASNGLNPMWNETFTFDVQFPELAMLRFHVEDGDFVGPKTDPFIGQSVISLDCVRCGYRSVPLKNQFSEECELSALLIDVQMFRIDNATLIQSARTVLQADRLAAKYSRALTGTISSASGFSNGAPMKIAPQLGSRDNDGSMESAADSPTTVSPLLTGELTNRMSLTSMNGVSQSSQDSDTTSVAHSAPPTPPTPATPSSKTSKKKGILSKFFNR